MSQLVPVGGVRPCQPWPHRLTKGDWRQGVKDLIGDRSYFVIAERRFADTVGEPALFVDGGETIKSTEHLERLVSSLIEAGLTRSHVVGGIGGGATTDLVGFAAAIALRGVDWVSVPTTVLAAVDAAIGGKTGVNLSLGKNLIGAFHQPLGVVIDANFWLSLPEVEWRSAAAEIFKAGLLRPDLMQRLESCATAQEVARYAVLAAELKLDVVAADPDEQSLRLALNLGHTLAHALETQANGRLQHGEAVAIGLVAVLRLNHPQAERFIELLSSWGLPTELPNWADSEGLIDLMRRDKKSTVEGLRVVLPGVDGSCRLVQQFNPERLIDAMG